MIASFPVLTVGKCVFYSEYISLIDFFTYVILRARVLVLKLGITRAVRMSYHTMQLGRCLKNVLTRSFANIASIVESLQNRRRCNFNDNSPQAPPRNHSYKLNPSPSIPHTQQASKQPQST